jgi:seryl-tRNA synthetase
LLRLDAFDPERGAKIAGHRGFFLTEDGVDLNQALINYGLDFLRTKGFKKVMTPFMMRKNMMAKTAQLDQFDEELYNVGCGLLAFIPTMLMTLHRDRLEVMKMTNT